MKGAWLITGGCGFIGSNLVAYLLKNHRGIRIRVLDNLKPGSVSEMVSTIRFNCAMGDPLKNISVSIGDIRDYGACVESVEGVDTVVHLAANTGVSKSVEDPRADMEANVTGTLNMLEASRHAGVKKFIFASSGAPAGEVLPPIHENKVPRPVSPYGASKLAGEAYCQAYWRSYGLPTISLRFGNVYGPGCRHKDSVVARFMKRALEGEPLEIFGDGSQTRDFIYIEDILRAVTLAGQSCLGGEVFQIATHRETTINEMAARIKALVEKKTGRKVGIFFGKPRQGDVKRNFSDISKARRMLGFEPLCGTGAGLEKTLEYFLREGALCKDRAQDGLEPGEKRDAFPGVKAL